MIHDKIRINKRAFYELSGRYVTAVFLPPQSSTGGGVLYTELKDGVNRFSSQYDTDIQREF